METNAFYQIGRDHKVCEDYAICGMEPFPYTILSDGCSTGKHTDVGSRILVSMTKKNIALFNPDNYIDFIRTVIFQAKTIAKIMDVEKECLLATLILTVYLENKVYVLMIGDGCFIYKQDNEIKFIKHEYLNNYPYYPIYINSELDDSHKGLVINKNEIIEQEQFNHIELYQFEKIDLLITSSDGIFSFTNGDSVVDFEIFKNEVADIKSFTGEFIERKMKRMTKNYLKKGFYNSDDWSMTGLFLGD